MTSPVSTVPIQQPAVGSYNLNDRNLKAGYFVVNPPTIRPYSFYEDLKKGDNYFHEALKVFSSKEMPEHKSFEKKKSSKVKKAASWIIFIASAIFAYQKRTNIVQFFKKLKK